VRNATTIPTNITIYTPAILIRPILFPDSAEIKAKERFINHFLPTKLTLKFRFVEHGSIAEQSTFSVSGFGLGNLPNKVGSNDIMQSLDICTIAMVLNNLSRECRHTFRPFGSIVLSELKDPPPRFSSLQQQQQHLSPKQRTQKAQQKIIAHDLIKQPNVNSLILATYELVDLSERSEVFTTFPPMCQEKEEVG